MSDLIEALLIFKKYKDIEWPTNCSHDVFAIMDVTQEEVHDKDKARLYDLGFLWSDDDECWISFRFGSA